MRKIVVVALVGCLMFAAIPVTVLAGDPHAVRNRWAGVAIGASVVTLGGLLLGAFGPVPVAAAVPPPPPPVVYAPPPPPPVVYYAPPPVVYATSPVVVYKPWGPPGHWKQRGHAHWTHRNGWDH
jgi:hypothetical protein